MCGGCTAHALVCHASSTSHDTAVTIGAVVAVTVVIGVFLFGRRRGRKSTTIVEVRRF